MSLKTHQCSVCQETLLRRRVKIGARCCDCKREQRRELDKRKSNARVTRWLSIPANRDKRNAQRRASDRTAETHRRYSLLRNAEGSFTREEWNAVCERQGGRCAHCSTLADLTVDHIVPLSRGGTNYIGNIQGLCATCNSRKGARTES